MKALKKLCALSLSCLICGSSLGMEANALFGNSHYCIGKKVLEESKISLSESEKDAFLSGMVYADIGRFKFDRKLGIDSDSNEFIEEMKKHTKTSEEEWFVKGFEMHVLQDKKVVEFFKKACEHKKIDFSYDIYLMACVMCDYYFMRENKGIIFNDSLEKVNVFQGIKAALNSKSENIKLILEQMGLANLEKSEKQLVNEEFNLLIKDLFDDDDELENKYSLVMYADLIKETYHSLGLEVSLDEITEQEANTVGLNLLLDFCLLDAFEEAFDDEAVIPLYSSVELAANALTEFCVSNLPNENSEANQ